MSLNPGVQTTGPSTSTDPYLLPVKSGASFTSILSVDNNIGGYTMVGIPDGLGAYDNGDGTFTVLMNHEIGSTNGIVRAHGAKGAFVSSWVINKSDLTVVSGSDLITSVYGWNSGTQSSNTTTSTVAFNRFCSADLPATTAYYNPSSGLGSQARIFMNGEEGGSNGFALATVASGVDKGKTYVLGKFNLSTNGSGSTGVGGWENLLANPFAQDKTVVIGNNDGGTGIMSNSVVVYVGNKQSTGSEADKAGLTNGVAKFVNVTGNSAEIANSTTRATNITNGTRFTLSATSSTTFSRPEDGAWNPVNPNEYFFVTTDRLDQVNDGLGTQVGRSRLWKLTFDDITNPDAGGKIDLLLDGTEGGNMFDNIAVDNDGSRITLLEDVGGNAHNGKIWQYDVASKTLTQVARHDPARFGDISVAATAPFTNDEETSGVIDVSSILGSGWYLLVDQAHYTTGISTAGVEGGQLLAMYNPSVAYSYQTANSPANDVITGTATADYISTGAGSDVVNAGAGNDIIIGGAGRDIVVGGSGADTFAYNLLSDSNATAADAIRDFAGGDRFQLPFLPAGLTDAGTVAGATLADAATAAFSGRGAQQAVFFTWTPQGRKFLAVNDGNAAFSPTNDFVVELPIATVFTPGVSSYFI